MSGPLSLVNPHTLTTANEPQEWKSSAWDEAIQRMRENEDEPTRRLRAIGITPKWEDDYARLREGQRFFLMRNTWAIRAESTGRMETYYTMRGTHIEYPFCGLDPIYVLKRSRVGVTDEDAVNEVWAALALGEIEPITRERAYALYRDIEMETGRNLRPKAHTQEVPR